MIHSITSIRNDACIKMASYMDVTVTPANTDDSLCPLKKNLERIKEEENPNEKDPL